MVNAPATGAPTTLHGRRRITYLEHSRARRGVLVLPGQQLRIDQTGSQSTSGASVLTGKVWITLPFSP
ncbi:hypothetical protein QFZ24_000998 [Streptomyces phaeochromogenes]|jgi:hypothetical protein|nr:hypothetical protein [Streptomyces phaeochromogenes]